MNKLLLTSTLVIATFIASSQGIEIRPTAFYTFRESVPVSVGTARINDGGTYGLELAFVSDRQLEFLASYQTMPTTVDIRRWPSLTGDIGNSMLISYWQIGANRLFELDMNEKILPYAGIKAGIGTYDFENSKYQTIVRAAIGLQAGVKVMATPRVGLQLGLQLQSPISGIGLGVSAGTGGVSTGVSTYSYMLQFSLGGGLVFKLK